MRILLWVCFCSLVVAAAAVNHHCYLLLVQIQRSHKRVPTGDRRSLDRHPVAVRTDSPIGKRVSRLLDHRLAFDAVEGSAVQATVRKVPARRIRCRLQVCTSFLTGSYRFASVRFASEAVFAKLDQI